MKDVDDEHVLYQFGVFTIVNFILRTYFINNKSNLE